MHTYTMFMLSCAIVCCPYAAESLENTRFFCKKRVILCCIVVIDIK
jgi:hypothetical protein